MTVSINSTTLCLDMKITWYGPRRERERERERGERKKINKILITSKERNHGSKESPRMNLSAR